MTDFYRALAARIFKVPYASVTAAQRRQAKAAAHQHIYGGNPEVAADRKRLDAHLRTRRADTHTPGKGKGSYTRKPKHRGNDHE